jgi:hypothetical protein
MGVHIESDLPQGLVEPWLQSEVALDRFVSGFLRAETAQRDFTHRAHLAVAAGLVLESGRDDALARFRETIPALQLRWADGGEFESLYHETMTVFWIRQITRVLARFPQEWKRLDKVRALVEAYGEFRRLDRAVYSWDILQSPEARQRYVPPSAEQTP